MTTAIEFTGNYEDLSTDMGFQFKFLCERCQNGYMSTFEANKLGVAGGFLRSASGFLGGGLGKGADSAFEVQRAVGGRQHDAALRKAVQEVKPLFKQCRNCGNWICGEVCWNANATMCKECAPIAEEVETRARAQFVETQVTNDTFLEENIRMSAKGKEVAAKCSNFLPSARSARSSAPRAGPRPQPPPVRSVANAAPRPPPVRSSAGSAARSTASPEGPGHHGIRFPRPPTPPPLPSPPMRG